MTTNTKYRQSSLQKKSDKQRLPKSWGYPRISCMGWVRADRLGSLDLGASSQTPQSAMTLNEELIRLRQQVKEQEKEIRRLKSAKTKE